MSDTSVKAKNNVLSSIPYSQRIAWFHQARFGMFIHYGLYSLLERGEWVMFNERMAADEYAKLAGRFAPEPGVAEEWVKLAVAAGARYAVLTTRHHDGFCLYDSKVSDFTLARTKGRDLVAEFTDACRKHGLKVGLYYSLLDWRFPGYFEPDRYPESAKAMVDQLHAQVRELMTNYGRVDMLWYDGGWISHGRVEKDEAEFWRSAQLNQMVYDLQPHILINNRSGMPLDLDTPEQHVTASEPGRGWESCMTIGDSAGWGYVRDNPNRKTVATLLQNLVTAAAGEGNFLLNIAPRPNGHVDGEDGDRLLAMGEWLAHSGAAVYGSQRCELYDQQMPGAPLGRWTRQGNTAYLNVFRWPGTTAIVPLVATKALSARMLQTGQSVRVRQEYNGRLVLEGLPDTPPHPLMNTIAVEFATEPRNLAETDKAAWISGSL